MRIEIRADGAHISGYVNATEKRSRPVITPHGRVIEEIEPRAFAGALERAQDVPLTVDHQDRVYASTRAGTLELREDEIGLYAQATVTDGELIDAARRGMIRGWSFGMYNVADRIEPRADGLPLRRIQALDEMYEAQRRKLDTAAQALENARKAQQKHADAIDAAQQRIAEINRRLEELASQTGDTSEEQEQLNRQLTALNEELETAQRNYDAASRGVSSWTVTVNKSEAALYKLQRQIEDNNTALDDAADTAEDMGDSLGLLGRMGEDAGAKIGELVAKAGEMFSLAGLIGIATSIGKAIYEMGEQYLSAAAAIEKATGATRQGLAELTDTAYAALGQSYTTLDTVAGAVGEINTRFGVTGDELERLTVLFTEYARVNNTDVVGSVQSISKVEKAWNLEMADTGMLMDKLTRGAQASGISVDSLASSLVENKAQFTALGYSLNDAIALLSMMEMEGLNATQVMSGLRFAANRLARTNQDSADGIREYIRQIEEAATQTEAARIGIEAFGDEAGTVLVEAIRSGRFELEAWTETIASADGALQATAETSLTFGEIWQNIKNQFAASVQELRQEIEHLTGATADALTQSDELLENARNNYETSGTRIAAASSVAQEYAARLMALEEQGVSTSEAQQEYNNLIEQLNAIMPELNLQLDEQTGLLRGGAAALLDNIEAWKQWALQQAMQEKYTETLRAYGTAQLEVAENSVKQAEAQAKVNRLQGEYDVVSREFQKTLDGITDDRAKYAAMQSEEYRALEKLGKELQRATDEYEDYGQAVLDAQQVMQDAQDEIDQMSDVVKDAAEATSDSTEDMAAGWDAYAAGVTASIESINSDLMALQDEYSAAYDTARASIDGQISKFKEMHVASAQEAEAAAEAMRKALDSQIAYLQGYNENFEALMSRNIEGIDVLAEKLSDGSEESAAILAGLADATDDEIREIIDKLGRVEQGKEEFCDQVARMQTDYDERMEQLRATTQEVMDDVVAKLDESERAYANGMKTAGAVADGLRSQLGSIQVVAAEINAILASIGSAMDEISAKGSSIAKPASSGRKGTSAAVGLYRVPYDKFEAVLHQGERVLTAAEARVYNERETRDARQSNTDNSRTVNVGGIHINGTADRRQVRQIERAVRNAIR